MTFLLIFRFQGISDLVARTKPEWGDHLQPLKTYTVVIVSSTDHGDGGTMQTAFETGGLILLFWTYLDIFAVSLN